MRIIIENIRFLACPLGPSLLEAATGFSLTCHPGGHDRSVVQAGFKMGCSNGFHNIHHVNNRLCAWVCCILLDVGKGMG